MGQGVGYNTIVMGGGKLKSPAAKDRTGVGTLFLTSAKPSMSYHNGPTTQA